MALFLPSNITPSTMGPLGNGTVDARFDLKVSWQVNGQSAMTKYQIDILGMNTGTYVLLSSGVRTDGCPFYGKDENGNTQFFSYTFEKDLLLSAGIINGGTYKLRITSWWSETDSIVQWSPVVFFCKDAPELTINEFPEIIREKTYRWTATYNQAQGDTVMWVRWMLAQDGNFDTPVYDSGEIVTAQLALDYNGLFDGAAYAVRCMVETESGVKADTGWKEFAVQYDTTAYEGLASAAVDKKNSAVLVRWPAAVEIQGKANGPYTIQEETLQLPQGSSVLWDSRDGAAGGLGLTPTWAVTWRGNVSGENWSPVQVSGKNGRKQSITFSLTIPEEARAYTAYEGAQFTISHAVYGTDASETKGSVTYQDSDGTERTYVWGAYTPPSSPPRYLNVTLVDSVSLVDAQTCLYLWVTNGIPDSFDQPQFGENTYLLANFRSGLGAGTIETSVAVESWEIYRRDTETEEYRKVATVPAEELRFWDCSAVSQANYIYYVFGVGENVFATSPMLSNEVKVCLWDWTILSCTAEENGYAVEDIFRFGLNVSSGGVENNNEPSILKNFTRYPTVQLAPQNYRSGTLSAYIGKINAAYDYEDSRKVRDAIYALSTTKNTLFLKNRKGDLMRVRIAGPITMTTKDDTREQAQVVSVPWVEVSGTDREPIIMRTSEEDEDDDGNGHGEAYELLTLTQSAKGIAADAAASIAEEQIVVQSSAEGIARNVGVGQGADALALHTSAEGKAIPVEKTLSSEQLALTSSGNAAPVDGGASKAGELLTLTQNADGVGAAAVPDAGGEKLKVNQSGEGIAAGTIPAEGSGGISFAGTGDGVSASAGSGAATQQLTLENSASPEVAALGTGLAALGLRLVSRAEGRAFAVGWEYPVQDGETLLVTQVYGALQAGSILILDQSDDVEVVTTIDGAAFWGQEAPSSGAVGWRTTGASAITGYVIAGQTEQGYENPYDIEKSIVLHILNTEKSTVTVAFSYFLDYWPDAEKYPGKLTVDGVAVSGTEGTYQKEVVSGGELLVEAFSGASDVGKLPGPPQTNAFLQNITITKTEG